jgi:ribonuclease HII
VLPQLTAEQALWEQGLQLIAGVDEVGMGPLAGPVVAAAVVLPAEAVEKFPQGVRDSKTLSEKARERLANEIRQIAVGVGLGLVEVEEIDRINIYHAGLRAMRLALDQLPQPPQHVLIDGRALPELPYPQTRVIKGDRDVYSIAAASIVAKVHRDHLMLGLHETYPQYGFASHKGYGTAAHRAALREFGPCPAHRRSFRLV